ncbi:3BHS7 dehydrogenase, partial [Eudromia elegans]|nr:3BHS7 dehydrogenase [Eudromia elegans]
MEVVGPNARGDPFVWGDEDTPYPVRHSHPYALSKAQAERLVLDANGATVAGGRRLRTCALRPTGVYGEGHPLLARLLRGGRAGRLLLLPPNAHHSRVYAGE